MSLAFSMVLFLQKHVFEIVTFEKVLKLLNELRRSKARTQSDNDAICDRFKLYTYLKFVKFEYLPNKRAAGPARFEEKN